MQTLMAMPRFIALSLLMIVALATPAMVEACPLCSQALDGQAKYGNLPLAYMWSILFMMSMPFLLLGSFGTYMYYQIRKVRQNIAPATASLAQEPYVAEQLEAAQLETASASSER